MSLSDEELNEIVTDYFGIQGGEKILISGVEEWVRRVAVQVEEVGALPLLTTSSHKRDVNTSKYRFVPMYDLSVVAEEIDVLCIS